MTFAAVDPFLFQEVDFNGGEPVAGEEQVLVVDCREEVRSAGQVDLDGPGSVAVVGDQLVAGLDVIRGEVGAPPAGGDADLRIGRLNVQIERGGLQLLPYVGREGVDLLSGGMAFAGEAIGAAPADGGTVLVLPDGNLLGLPVSAVAGGLVRQFRQEELTPVVGVHFAHERAVIDFLGNRDDDHTVALAVETEFIDDNRVAVFVEQLDLADELQVLAVDGQLFAAFDLLAFLLGETGHDGLADGQRQTGLRFFIEGPDEDLASRGGDARRRGDPDHIIADNLEIGDADAVGENDLPDAREAGTVDGHRLPGHHLCGEEHLDAQPFRQLAGRIEDVARREGAHQGHGQKYSEMFKYLLHN